MTYAEIARELGFGDDWFGFQTWADLHDVQPRDEVDDDIAQILRDAHAGQPDDVAAAFQREDAVLDQLRDVVDGAGYETLTDDDRR